MKSVVLDLLRRYLQVETQFQQGKAEEEGAGRASPEGGTTSSATRSSLGFRLCSSSLRQMCDHPEGAAHAQHDPRPGVHLLPRPGGQEEPPGDHVDCELKKEPLPELSRRGDQPPLSHLGTELQGPPSLGRRSFVAPLDNTRAVIQLNVGFVLWSRTSFVAETRP